MRRHLQAALLVLTGLGLLHASLFTDLCLRYVKEDHRPLLIASGALLVLLGAAGAVLARTASGGDGHAHGHDHGAVPRVAWLLLLPVLGLLLHPPPALGAYTAARTHDRAVERQRHFDPLPATGPLPMTLTDFTARVQQDPTQAIRSRGIRMSGFVTPAGRAGGWYLTRIVFTCCAADSQSVKIRMYGSPAPPADTWLAVDGTWHPAGTLGTKTAVAALDVHHTDRIAPPVNASTDDLPLTPS
ncbi:TIGR03943 family putative permease subunit [Streptomyces sp. NPDC101225]|uniref:TIGR03943 family putative permease subunit n=1 Tax=Streptomyces sp. NPDC101225 TaxID=3366135 RepID=UPI0038033CF3